MLLVISRSSKYQLLSVLTTCRNRTIIFNKSIELCSNRKIELKMTTSAAEIQNSSSFAAKQPVASPGRYHALAPPPLPRPGSSRCNLNLNLLSRCSGAAAPGPPGRHGLHWGPARRNSADSGCLARRPRPLPPRAHIRVSHHWHAQPDSLVTGPACGLDSEPPVTGSLGSAAHWQARPRVPPAVGRAHDLSKATTTAGPRPGPRSHGHG